MFALWGFAVATAFLPGIYSAPFMPRWWMVAIGLGFAAFDLRAVDERVLWCLGIGLLWSGLTLLWSPVLDGGMLPLAFLVLFGLIVIASASSSDLDRSNGLSGFALGMFLSSGTALAQKLGYAQNIIGGAQPVGLFFNVEVFAETAAPIAVWCLLQRSYAHRFIGAVIAVAACCTSERVALFGLGAGLIYGLVQNWKLSVAIFGTLFAIGIASLYLKVFDSNERILLWGTAIRSITFAGRGIGWWFQAHPFGREEVVHGDALQLMVEAGVPSLALIAVPVLAWFGKGSRAERACFLVCAIEFVASFPLHMPATTFIFAVAAGALVSRRADVRIPGLQGREAIGDGARSAAAYAASLFGRRRWGGALVSDRSAYPQYTDVARQDSGAGGAI